MTSEMTRRWQPMAGGYGVTRRRDVVPRINFVPVGFSVRYDHAVRRPAHRMTTGRIHGVVSLREGVIRRTLRALRDLVVRSTLGVGPQIQATGSRCASPRSDPRTALARLRLWDLSERGNPAWPSCCVDNSDHGRNSSTPVVARGLARPDSGQKSRWAPLLGK